MTSTIDYLRRILNCLLIRNCDKLLENCNNEKKDLKLEIDKLNRDSKYYQDRIDTLTTALANAVHIIDISPYLTEKVTVNPYDLIKKYGTYDIICGDFEYYALSEENWKNILSTIQIQVMKVLKEYLAECRDCDDFALLMDSFVMSAFANASLDKQGAFCIIWSNSHAYNGFVTFDNKIYIYEPQNNVIIGELGKTLAPYDSRYIWFMG